MEYMTHNHLSFYLAFLFLLGYSAAAFYNHLT
jgi:hypothetical protein